MSDADQQPASGPFEGPEKLLEIWFAPSPAECPDSTNADGGKFGLRRVPRAQWEEMLDIVKCKILSVVEGMETDAYLLRSVSVSVAISPIIVLLYVTTCNCRRMACACA